MAFSHTKFLVVFPFWGC